MQTEAGRQKNAEMEVKNKSGGDNGKHGSCSRTEEHLKN